LHAEKPVLRPSASRELAKHFGVGPRGDFTVSAANERIAKWDARYAAGEGRHAFVASPPLRAAVDGFVPGRALDVAAGAGRHAIYLAERGWRVVALEGSSEGAHVMCEEAARRGLQDRIESRIVDLESPTAGAAFEPDGYDLVCDFYFLDRALLPWMRAAVRRGGLLVAAIHLQGPSTMNPAFLVAPGELAALAAGWGWKILHAREGEGTPRDGGHGSASSELIARRPPVGRTRQ
jgi:tellurite methyltransferase